MQKRLRKTWSLLLIIILAISLFTSVAPVHTYSSEASLSDASTNSSIIIDGHKDPAWENVPVLGASANAGFEGFQIGNLRITNDESYLYYWVDAVNVPNWGDNGQYIDIALQVNDADSGVSGNPWGSQFNYSNMDKKPQFHIVQRVKNDNEVNGAALYSSSDFNNPLLATWGNVQDAQFAVDRTQGFEGKIPLEILGLHGGDSIKAHVALSGNNSGEHGAFDAIPEDSANQLSASWNESGSNVDMQGSYCSPYVITDPSTQLRATSFSPAIGSTNVPVSTSDITISFNEPIALTGLEAPSVTDAVYDISADHSNLTFHLKEPLASNHTYHVTIPANSITGSTFGSLPNTINFEFTTELDVANLFSYTIHYYRYDGKQNDWDLWVYPDGGEGKKIDFTSTDADGFAVTQINEPFQAINVIARPGSWASQEDTRKVTVPEGQKKVEVWMVQGNNNVFYNLADADISAKIQSAMMDSLNMILLTTTQSVQPSDLPDFHLKDETTGEDVPVTAAAKSATSVKLTISNPSQINVRHIYTVNHPKFKGTNVTVRGALDDPQFYYGGDDLGLTYTTSASTFKVWAPTAQKVSVALYDNVGTYNEQGLVTDNTGGQETEMNRSDNGVWSLTLNGDLAGKYYMYKVEFADNAVNYAVDPYAKAVSANGQRTAILSLHDTDPANWSNDRKPPMINDTDAIVYELHVRDFSISPSSGVSNKNKGKFTAFAETGLKDSDGNSLGIDHLAELGVTHVHLLPSFDFNTINELKVNDPNSADPKFNWGYDPKNYNVPEGSYSTDPTNPAKRITEFKEMVQALHAKGIRVIMDVVYNHTFSIEGGPFNPIVPGYFYRSDDAGTFTNGSGVGNEIASERPMVRKYIEDSVKYWAKEYDVDGFRFDLMGLIDTTTMKQITDELKQQVDPSLLIYGEPWTGGSSPLQEQTLKGSQKGSGFAVFNDNLRGAIKGDSDGAGKGFATGESGKEADIIKGVKGAIDDFTSSPAETINYVTAHDNLNLWDKVVTTQGLADKYGFLKIKDGQLIGGGSVEDAVHAADPYKDVDPSSVFTNETVRRSLLANGIVLTSQGIPFIQAGDELLRTKYGDSNSYKSPDAVNQINWDNKKLFKDVTAYYEGLIKLRKEHPAFRLTTADDINKNLQVIHSSDNIVAFKLGEFAGGDSWKNIVVIYNGNSTDKQVSLPTSSSTWHVVVSDHEAGTNVLDDITSNQVTVPRLSMMVLYDNENQYVPVLSKLDIQSPYKAIEPGVSFALKVTASDQFGRAMTGEDVVWSSSNENVATVGASGRVTGIAKGETKITAKSGSVTNTLTLYVDNLKPGDIQITGETLLYTTMNTQLKATVKDQYGQILKNAAVTWSSSDRSIAEVSSSGWVEAISPGTVKISASSGSAKAEITIEVKKYVERTVQIEYDRPDQNYTGWNLWVWGTGVQDDQILFDKFIDGKAIANVKVAPGVTRIGFIVRLNNWDAKDVDADRYIELGKNDEFVKVIVTSGKAEFYKLPSIGKPVLQNGNATFYYRDDELFRNNDMSKMDKVRLKFDGHVYDMMRDDKNQYFAYTVTGLTEGTHSYSYLVTISGSEQEVLDPYNTVNGKSELIYTLPNVNVIAKFENSTIKIGQHSVLGVQISGDPVHIQEIYADLSAVGGPQRFVIDPELMAQTITVKDTTTAGSKSIPVIAIDEFGNAHRTTAALTVQTKTYTNSLDFDWDEARIYFMLTDRFYDGDPSNDDPSGEHQDKSLPETYHGGDFQGIIDKLDYLQDLGINTIWITPIVDNIDYNVGKDQPWQNQYAYHGYWAKNFEAIDEHLGDLKTFQDLINKAHDHSIKIMVDVVLNHAGYGMKESDVNAAGATNYPTAEDKSVFSGMLRETPGQGDLEGEVAGLPDFKTEDPAVRNQLIAWQAGWLERAKTSRGDTIDYFRVDTAKHVDATTWKAFKNALTRLNPDFNLIGESFGDNADNGLGLLRSGEMDSLLDFDFNDKARDFVNGQLDQVESYLEIRNDKIDNTATVGQFLSSHDEDGFLSEFVNGDEGKLKVAAALQISIKGQPVIYYGEELGRSGKNADFAKGVFSDNRSDMPWNQLSPEAALHDHYEKLLNIRAKYSKVFSKGSHVKIAGGNDEQYLFYKREYDGQSVYVGLNISRTQQSVNLQLGLKAGTVVTDEYSGLNYTVDSAGNVTVKVPGMDDGGTIILTVAKQGGDTGGGNGNGNNTGSQGGSIPIVKPADADTVIISQPMVAQGKVQVTLPAGKTRVLLPAAASAFNSDNSLVIQKTDMEVNIPASIIKQLKELVPAAKLTSAQLSVQLIPLSSADTERSMNKSSVQQHASVHAASGIYQIIVSIVTDDGKMTTLKQFNSPVALTFHINSRANQDITWVYSISAGGTLRYAKSTKTDDSITASINEPGSYAVLEYDKKFSDVPDSYWASSVIRTLAAQQIIQGSTDTQFSPQRNVTRSEFISILIRALHLHSSGHTTTFTDVPSGAWYEDAVAAATESGLITGRSRHSFAPNSTITREEMAVILVRAYELIQQKSADTAKQAPIFDDVNSISIWAKDKVNKAASLGLLHGRGNNLYSPQTPLTRAESAQVIANLLNELLVTQKPQ
ncbi:type I pullulanase [Paenibacillus sediminis]|uniref:pullulanase n=1 Tax=Paenibacillus sediminis TaxID=664909 RepID=A0ABS4H2K3_9BACL|nr:type I pullulanase [Paenibacillus sediminis]MBP1936759.1 pullulanase [Paenibacillus sediminis]